MTDAEMTAVMKETRDAMQKAACVVRDECATYVRQFGGRISNEELARLIERMPLPNDVAPKSGDPSSPSSPEGA